MDLEAIVISLPANIKYLQDEYASLLVKGKCDDSTAQLFRSLQKRNSGFDNQSINNVRIAAELSSISNRTYSNRGTFRQVTPIVIIHRGMVITVILVIAKDATICSRA